MSYRILIIDDSELDRKFLISLINLKNIKIDEAESVEQAEKLLTQYNYTLLLCDIQMPEKDGFYLAKMVKETNDLKNIPIIFITSSNKEEKIVLRAFEVGVIEILNKNENREILSKKIEVFFAMGKYRKNLQKINNELKQDIESNERLLNNMLPGKTIQQLKLNGKVKPRKYSLASVLFTDFVNFSKLARYMSPDKLVSKLEFYFTQFDKILEINSVEKIKTIGDSYMCVGGIPIRNRSNPIDTVLASLKILEFVNKQKIIDQKLGEPIWDIRIGIHSGELIAGVIGTKKYAYDVWGETVNIASRIESFSNPGTISISGKTNLLIQKYIDTKLLGIKELKGVGETEIYEVKRIKKKYSSDNLGFSHSANLNIDFYKNQYELSV